MAEPALRIAILMGPSGSGKTTVGMALARRLDWVFFDADDLHPAANVEKIRHGIPLTDLDRASWLDAIHRRIAEQVASGTSAIWACSALKESYRAQLSAGLPQVVFIYLRVPASILEQRLKARRGHFADARLLPSQLATLELPADALVVDAVGSVEQTVDAVLEQLR